MYCHVWAIVCPTLLTMNALPPQERANLENTQTKEQTKTLPEMKIVGGPFHHLKFFSSQPDSSNCRIPGLIVSRRRYSLKNESEYNRGYSYANKWAGYSAI